MRWLLVSILATTLLPLGAVHSRNALAQTTGAPPRKTPPSAKVRPPARATAPSKLSPWSRGVSPANRTQALEIYRRGNAHFQRGQYSKAMAEYRRAIQLWEHPAIRYNMAVCLINLGRLVQAHFNLKRALRFGAPPLGGHYQQARTYVKLLLQRLARLKIRCRELGARVQLNGSTIFYGPDEKELALPAGQHIITASKPGFITVTRTLAVQPGRTTIVKLKLIPDADAVTTKRRWQRALPWAVLAGSLAVGLVGVPLFLKSAADRSSYQEKLTQECPLGCDAAALPDSIARLGRGARSYWAAGITFSTIGGLGIIAGAVLLVLNRPRAVRLKATSDTGLRTLRLTPTFHRQGFTLDARLSF